MNPIQATSDYRGQIPSVDRERHAPVPSRHKRVAIPPGDLPRFAGPWEPDLEERISLAAECADCSDLPRTPDAGKLVRLDEDWFQVMHNGVLTLAGAYYGDWSVDMIARCGGVHEPQEERVFHEVVKRMTTGAVMVELGCYWAYYSIWLARSVREARLILVEPIDHRQAVARRNLEVNDVKATIVRAAIGDSTISSIDFENGPAKASGIEQVTLDDLLNRMQQPNVDILHADIQGFEYAMLRGATRALEERRIKFVFISTHRWVEEGQRLDLHQTCRDSLTNRGYRIFAEHTPEESFTVDGLLAAHSPDVSSPVTPALSYRQA